MHPSGASLQPLPGLRVARARSGTARGADGSLLICGRISGAGQAMALDPFNGTARFVAACPEEIKLCMELQTKRPAIIAATGNCQVHVFYHQEQTSDLVESGMGGNRNNEFVRKRVKVYLPLGRSYGSVLEFDVRSCLGKTLPFPRAAEKLSDAHGNFAYLLTGYYAGNQIGVYCLKRHKVLRYISRIPQVASAAPAGPLSVLSGFFGGKSAALAKPSALPVQPVTFSHIRYISRLDLTLCIGTTVSHNAFIALLKPNLTKTYSIIEFSGVSSFLDSIAVVELQDQFFVPLFQDTGDKYFLVHIDHSDKNRPTLLQCGPARNSAPTQSGQDAEPRRLEACRSLSVAVLGSSVFLGKEGGIVEEFRIVPK